MSRYKNTKMKKTLLRRGLKDVKTYESTSQSTTFYSTIPQSDNDIYVITQAGDRLDLLASQFYGDVDLWWYIAKANGLTFMTIPTGTSLRIPGTIEYAIGS